MAHALEREVELTLPMIPDIEVAAVNAATDFSKEMGLGAEQVDEIAHAVIEACINAREHACCVDQRIYLRFAGSSTSDNRARIEISITDHGRGFDPAQARAHRNSQEGVPHKRGWGLQIIEAHMDEVEILSSSAGTTIRMVKYGDKRND